MAVASSVVQSLERRTVPFLCIHSMYQVFPTFFLGHNRHKDGMRARQFAVHAELDTSMTSEITLLIYE